ESGRMCSLRVMVESELSCVISIVAMRVSLGGADECSLDSREDGVRPIGGQRLTAAGAGSRPATAAKKVDRTAVTVPASTSAARDEIWNYAASSGGAPTKSEPTPPRGKVARTVVFD